MTFRFDDVCINADMELINQMTDYLFERFYGCEVVYAVSPMVHNDCEQRVFPKIFNAHSDYRKFYEPDKTGIPEMNKRATLAGHGIVHVDHRLLSKDAQEMSILISTSLVGSKIFVPPFNKWNVWTETICREHNIKLVKFEDGWKSMEHNSFKDSSFCTLKSPMWYLHAREWTFEQFKKWFECA